MVQVKPKVTERNQPLYRNLNLFFVCFDWLALIIVNQLVCLNLDHFLMMMLLLEGLGE